MTDVPSHLTTLIEHLTSLGSPFGRYMRPGRSDADVRAAVASFGLAPPTELVDWFGQFDGPDDDAFQQADEQASALELFPGVRPLTLDQACELATELRAAAEDLGEDAEQFWRPNWFPIMVGPGSIFALDCGPELAPRKRRSGAPSRTRDHQKRGGSLEPYSNSSTGGSENFRQEARTGTQSVDHFSRRTGRPCGSRRPACTEGPTATKVMMSIPPGSPNPAWSVRDNADRLTGHHRRMELTPA